MSKSSTNYNIQIEVRHTGFYRLMSNKSKQYVDDVVTNKNKGIASFTIRVRNKNFLNEPIFDDSKDNLASSLSLKIIKHRGLSLHNNRKVFRSKQTLDSDSNNS